jgi:hypothetical protein
MASKINILPHSLDLVIGEIGRGDGNGGGGEWFSMVFGGGGFDGWRRKRKRKMLLLGFLLIFGLGLLLYYFWLGKRRSKDWVLGFCVGGVLMGFGLRREQVQK